MKSFCIGLLLLGCSHMTLQAQIVNVENTRLNEYKDGWQGLIDIRFYSVKNTSSLFKLNNTIRLQYRKKRHTFLFLNNYNLINTGGENFEQNYFQHFRYNLMVDSNLTLEAFTQNQYDQIMLIKKRILAGSGPRFRFVDGRRFKLYIGLAYMFEYEEELQSSIIRRDHRMSSYLNVRLKLKDWLLLHNTTYYQPRFDWWPDYRVSSNTTFQCKVNKWLSFTSDVGLAFDTFPVDNNGIPRFTYRFTNGIAITL